MGTWKTLSDVVIALSVVAGGLTAAAADGSFAELEQQFRNPPREAGPAAYWDWLNGNADLKTITSDLEEAKAKGMSGLEIWDVGALSNPGNMVPAGPPFLGEESVAAIRHALKEGQRLGMRIGMIASSGWNAGGAWVTPDWALKHLFVSSQVVKGPSQVAGPLPFPPLPGECPKDASGLPVFCRDVAVLAVPQNADKSIARLEDVVNLTDQFKDGQLSWSAPAGEWAILRFVCSNSGQRLIAASPKSDGLFIDFLEPSATARHFKRILDRLGVTPQNAAEVGLAWLELDSMEMGEGIQWTDRFPEYFQHWCGYDPIPYLPILAGWKIAGATDAFRYDYNHAVAEQLTLSHYTTARDLLRKYGIQLVAEAGGPGPPISTSCPVDALKALGNVSVPRGEFWNRHRNMFLVKEIASASHIYGLKYVSAESFTTWRRWMDGPAVYKRLADRALCEGLNQFVFHTFAHSPLEEGLPGRAYHAGMDLNPRATWWSKSRPFIEYLSRSAHILQQGHFVADACAYYGDQTPNFWPLFHDVPTKPLYPGLDPCYDYDVVNSDVILNRMAVTNERVVLPDGMSYRLLVLPAQNHIPAEVLQKVAELVKAGATLLGPKPTRDPRLADQARRTARVQQLADELWGDDEGATAKGRPVGHGKVFAGLTPTQVLTALGAPADFHYDPKPGAPEADFIHRRTPDADFYFVRNTSTNAGSLRCQFRVKGRRPELWDPATGQTGIGIDFRQEPAGTALDLPLAAGGSAFVVFTSARPEKPLLRPAAPDSEESIPGPWTVRFAESWGAPAEMRLETLQSWTESADEGIKYFSGTVVYQKTVEIAAAKLAPRRRVFLDLGDVREVGEVFLNGQSLGVVWKPPFRVDLTPAAHPGKNELKIEIVNLWINRLQGDRVTKGRRYTRTNQAPFTQSLGGDEPWREQPSGLLGPVRLIFTPGEIQARDENAIASRQKDLLSPFSPIFPQVRTALLRTKRVGHRFSSFPALRILD